MSIVLFCVKVAAGLSLFSDSPGVVVAAIIIVVEIVVAVLVVVASNGNAVFAHE